MSEKSFPLRCATAFTLADSGSAAKPSNSSAPSGSGLARPAREPGQALDEFEGFRPMWRRRVRLEGEAAFDTTPVTIENGCVVVPRTERNLERSQLSRLKSRAAPSYAPTPPPLFSRRERADGALELPRFVAMDLYPLRGFRQLRSTRVAELANFTVAPYPDQRRVIDTVARMFLSGDIEQSGALINAECGSGKTEVALGIIHAVRGLTLILCHTVDLVEQNVRRARAAFPDAAVGQWGGGAHEGDCQITAATFQALAARPELLERPFDLIFVDECHHVPAETFFASVAFQGCLLLGVSATIDRKDGLSEALWDVFGNHVHLRKLNAVQASVELQTVRCDMAPPKTRGGALDRNAVFRALGASAPRNAWIVAKLAELVALGRTVVVSSPSKPHIVHLHALWEEAGRAGRLLTGDVATKKRKLETALFPLFATTPIVAEGLDMPRVDTLFQVMAPSNVEQLFGRLRDTPMAGKQPLLVLEVRESPWLCSFAASSSFFRNRGWPVTTHRALDIREGDGARPRAQQQQQPALGPEFVLADDDRSDDDEDESANQ